MFLFINISSPTIRLYDDQEQIELPYHGVQEQLPRLLLQHHRAKKYTDILVLNGPGSFTNLRVGCISLNLLASTHPEIRLRECSKPQLYHHCVTQDLLPKKCIMYIGQQTNIRDYDLKTQTFEKADRFQLNLENTDEYFCDQGAQLTLHPNIPQIDRKIKNNQPYLLWNTREFLVPYTQRATNKKLIHPDYQIDPTISPRKEK